MRTIRPEHRRPVGMRGFTIVWLGQVASLLGTAMTQFALTLWAYGDTGRATPLAMIGFSFVTPIVLLGPFIGVLVDRGNRKLLMMVSDVAAAASTAIVLVLYATGRLQIWHLYITAALSGIFQGFQWPAYSAAITLMLPKEQYARANGMLEMAGHSSAVFAPLLAGTLIGPLGLAGVLALDLVSAAVAIVALIFVRIPQPAQSEAGREAAGSFLHEAAYGFRYIRARPSLLGLQTVFMLGNFFTMVPLTVLAAMILGRTGNDRLVFGTVESVGAAGGLIGGLAMSAWGGPRRRVHGVLLGWFFSSLSGVAMMGVARGVYAWAVCNFLNALCGPVINGCYQAIWQAKVAPDVQGRVFTARQFIAWLVMPLAALVAGPLSDRLLEPAMSGQGSLPRVLGPLVGTGTGAGIGALFVVGGLLAALVGLGAYLFPAVRNAEVILPDHDQAAGQS